MSVGGESMTRTEQPVVVGVDGSASSAQAALWAATEAMRLSVSLRVILVNDDPAREAHAAAVVRDIRTSCQRAERELEITDEVSFGHPAENLLRQADSARLIVVGSRGQGAFQEALLGSTSAAVATHASCPVVIVPAIETPASSEVIVGVDGSTDSRPALHFAFESASQTGTSSSPSRRCPPPSSSPAPTTTRTATNCWRSPSRTCPRRFPLGRENFPTSQCVRWYRTSLRCARCATRLSTHDSSWSATVESAGSPDCSWVRWHVACCTTHRAQWR